MFLPVPILLNMTSIQETETARVTHKLYLGARYTNLVGANAITMQYCLSHTTGTSELLDAISHSTYR